MLASNHLLLEFALVMVALLLALWFRPWRVLRFSRLRLPWLAMMALLPWVWSLQGSLPGGGLLQMSGACLLVLMFGWPLAVASLPLVAGLGAWLGGLDSQQGFVLLAWNGIVPATLVLAAGWMTRRWLPEHLCVYIMARGFLGPALALGLASLAGVWWQGPPAALSWSDMMLGHWLTAWGEAMATGLLTAFFVAFRPEWLLTYSDHLYLPAGRKS